MQQSKLAKQQITKCLGHHLDQSFAKQPTNPQEGRDEINMRSAWSEPLGSASAPALLQVSRTGGREVYIMGSRASPGYSLWDSRCITTILGGVSG